MLCNQYYIQGVVAKAQEKLQSSDTPEQALISDNLSEDVEELADMIALLDAQTTIRIVIKEPLTMQNPANKVNILLVIRLLVLELKPFCTSI